MTGATVEPKGAQSSLEGRGSRGFAPSRLFAALSRIDQATREALIVAAATAGLWLLIERLELCDRLFGSVSV